MKANDKMRVYHRYLGFFLAGIMAVYAVSGVIMIFRTTDFLKQDKRTQRVIDANLDIDQLSGVLRIGKLKVVSQTDDLVQFEQGSYNRRTGAVDYTVRDLPDGIKRLTKLHKATTNDPLFYLNIFFGSALLFFVVSAFWMFMPRTSVFRKGLYFSAAGVILVLLMIFL